MRESKLKRPSPSILIGVGTALAALVFLVLPIWRLSEQPDTSEPKDVNERVQRRMQQLSAADKGLFRGGTQVAAMAVPAASQRGRASHSAHHVPVVHSTREASGFSAFVGSPGNRSVDPEEGPLIQARTRLRPVQRLGNGESTDANRPSPDQASQRTEGAQPFADRGAQRTEGMQQAADKSGQKAESTQSIDKGAQKTDSAPQTADKTGGAQQATDTGNQKTDATQQATDKGAPKTDTTQSASNPTTQQPDGTDNGNVIKIKATSMTWDPNYAQRQNGDLFVFANSSLTAPLDLSSPAASISIWAHADKAAGVWPRVTVLVDGNPVGEVVVNSTVDKKFFLPVSIDPGHAVLELKYVNDFYDPNTRLDRNVYIHQVKVRTQ